MNGKVHAFCGVVTGLGTVALASKFPELQVVDATYPEFLSEILDKSGFITNIVEKSEFITNIIGEENFAEKIMCIAIFLISAWFGSLLPDIDHPTSTMSKKMGLLLLPYRILQFIFGKFEKTKHFVGHRGITHTVLFLVIPILIALFVPMYGIIKIALIGIAIGIFSHLFMDMLNPMGVPLFLPITRRKFRLLPKKLCIKTR